MRLRIGTRGSDLAVAQTQIVIGGLRLIDPAVEIETVVIQTHGDAHFGRFGDEHWPAGGFVGAIEQALLAGDIDAAVHSHKDLPTHETAGLVIAAVPTREVPFDVLVTAAPFSLDNPPSRPRVGTSSPRRAAQLRRVVPGVEIVPIRGNVPTRLAKVQELGLHGVVLAAAGLKRLGIHPPHCVILPADRFVPAPAQGALAVQMRAAQVPSARGRGESGALPALISMLDDLPTRRAVGAERSFLQALGAGCQTPAGALATTHHDQLFLHGQLFSRDGNDMVDAVETGANPEEVGQGLAARLLSELTD